MLTFKFSKFKKKPFNCNKLKISLVWINLPIAYFLFFYAGRNFLWWIRLLFSLFFFLLFILIFTVFADAIDIFFEVWCQFFFPTKSACFVFLCIWDCIKLKTNSIGSSFCLKANFFSFFPSVLVFYLTNLKTKALNSGYYGCN